MAVSSYMQGSGVEVLALTTFIGWEIEQEREGMRPRGKGAMRWEKRCQCMSKISKSQTYKHLKNPPLVQPYYTIIPNKFTCTNKLQR